MNPAFLPPQIERSGPFNIVRDDLIFGGSKKPALEAWLPKLGHENFAYAGSVFGWGAPALSEACAALGLSCVIALSKADYEPTWLERVAATPSTRLECMEPAPVADLNCRLASSYPACHVLPPGFEADGFRAALVRRALLIPAPARAWVPVISGTLLRALEQAWPDTEFHGVCVAKHHGYEGRATLYKAPEKFTQAARTPPPYPSCLFSDAKVWQFALSLGRDGDLIWNSNP